MKFMTKEWYESPKKADFGIVGFCAFLRVSKKAEAYSDNFFKKLYKQEENKWLKQQKEIFEIKFEDIYPDVFYATYADGTPLEPSVYEQAEKEYFEKRELARTEFDKRPAFDSE